MVRSGNFCTLELSEELISTIWDSFHGGASPSYMYDFFFSVMDGQNANTELITLTNIIPNQVVRHWYRNVHGLTLGHSHFVGAMRPGVI